MRRAAKFNSSPNLYQAQNQAILRILSIRGGWEIRRSFNQMGIHVGDDVRVLSRAPFGGALLIENRGTRVAISKQLAEKIRVEIIP
jgi:Fe2+ transport system protein FeoA